MATIVLADDDADLRAVYAACLMAAGHDVLEAADGARAVEVVRQRRPDLMLLDVWMPHLNGLEVLDALRHDPAAQRMRVLMLSNLADAETRLEAFGGGAVGYVVKGLALSDLMARVEASLADDPEAAPPS